MKSNKERKIARVNVVVEQSTKDKFMDACANANIIPSDAIRAYMIDFASKHAAS